MNKKDTSYYKDYVKCMNCGVTTLIPKGGNVCPVCHKKGCLSWNNEEEQEIEEYAIE